MPPTQPIKKSYLAFILSFNNQDKYNNIKTETGYRLFADLNITSI